jgi:DNA-binding phage protein
MINSTTRSHEDATLERFQRDPDLAAEYLAAILIDGDELELAHALNRIEKAFNKISHDPA